MKYILIVVSPKYAKQIIGPFLTERDALAAKAQINVYATDHYHIKIQPMVGIQAVMRRIKDKPKADNVRHMRSA